MRAFRVTFRISCLVFILVLTACGGGSGSAPTPPPPAPLGVQLSANTVTALPDGTPAPVTVTVTQPSGDSGAVTLSATSLPTGVTAQIASPSSGSPGTVTFTAQTTAIAGSYTVGIGASDSVTSGGATLTLVVGIVATVGAAVDTSSGVNGQLNVLMSTSFQLASWADEFFVANPAATTPLGNLGSQHIRMQVLERDIPQDSANTWNNFGYLDGMVAPIHSVADHSPEFQIAQGPAFLYDASGNPLAPTFSQSFAQYAANLVRYYNQGGFTDAGGTFHQPSASQYPNGSTITYWGIYNEPNINNVSAAQYVSLYNTTVPAMQAVDPTINFLAVELADGWDQPEQYLAAVMPGLTAQVDILATHFYATCNQSDSDQTLFNALDGFLPHITYIYTQLQSKGLTSVPVWMTENNVNADYEGANGMSTCNPTQKFVTDQRGTSAYFAAWRPTAFSKFGKVGLQALYHWAFAADQQYGEVNDGNVQLYLSYWVDYWLQRMFPSPPGAAILEVADTEPTPSTVEVLATRQQNGNIVIMVANHAVQTGSDNNGTGAPRTVVIDVSALGSFSQASLLTLDAKTDVTHGPSPVAVPPASRITLNFTGYGVSFLTLAI